MKYQVIDLGLTEYKSALLFQQELVEQRIKGLAPDTLILTEHKPVITIGRKGKKQKDLLISEKLLQEKGVELYEIERGGEFTVHCPGQIVGYPIMDLTKHGQDLHQYIRDLEEVVIRFLKKYELQGKRVKDFTGVWVADPAGVTRSDLKKICSIGVAVKHWVSYHGFALNINNGMEYFQLINPCGLKTSQMATLAQLLNKNIEISAKLKRQLSESFAEVFVFEKIDKA